MSDDHLSRFVQTRHNVAKFAVAVGALIEIHEIHVDLRPWNLRIKLRMKVENRLVQQFETANPHLRRRKRVHPKNDAHALFRLVRLAKLLRDFFGRLYRAAIDSFARDAPTRVKTIDDNLRMSVDLTERLVAIERLRAGKKPNFIFFFKHM